MYFAKENLRMQMNKYINVQVNTAIETWAFSSTPHSPADGTHTKPQTRRQTNISDVGVCTAMASQLAADKYNNLAHLAP